MTKRNKNNANMSAGRLSCAVARQVRGIITSLTIPTILTACAPAPHVGHDHAENSTGNSVLFVGATGKTGESATSSTPVADEIYRKANAPFASVSPADQYIPLSSDISIFEKVLSKYRVGPEPQAQKQGKKEKLAASKKSKALPPAELAPVVSFKSSKDGIWERVRKRLMLTAYEHDSVMAEVDKIRRSPGAVHFLSKKAEPFLFFIVDEIERRGLPMDLALVPMVESAFQPAAVSPKDAAGIWQFIPGTAANYGLRLVDGYDGRYDIYASTKAALKYLSKLQGQFGGDWLLALAAYNAGEGAVQRAIATNQKAGLGTSFWELNLPAETKAYVPKILALSRVIADPQSHGVNLHKINSLPYLARVEINTQVQLGQAVAGMGMSWDEFYGLNPAFKPDVAAAPPYNLLLPLDKAQMLVATLQGSRLVAARKYVVKKGETLGVIAKQEGVPPLKLAEWNGLKADSRVKPGQELIIYPV